jgi:gluconolactonase
LPGQKKFGFFAAIIIALISCVNLAAQSGGEIVKVDPGLSALIAGDARVEKVADGFGFVEGPVWVHNGNSGYLLFSDIPANVIRKWSPDGKVSVFLEKSGFTGADASDVGYKLNNGHAEVTLIGSNGITVDKQGSVVYCQHGNGAVERLEKDGKRTVLASKYDGKRLNSPNDLVYKSDGALYFTDPPFGFRKVGEDPKKELPYEGVYRLADGKLQLVYKDFKAPNGIAFTPDEKYLYINDSASKTYWKFPVKSDGTLGEGKLFFDMSSSKDAGVPDGMKIDQQGNIYGVGPGGIWILTPEGKHLGTIKFPEQPANLAWGDADGKTLYVTATTGLYRIHVNIPGIRP